MKRNVLLFVAMILLSIPSKGYSENFAYFIANDQVIKLDTDTDSVVQIIKAPSAIEGFLGNWDSRAVDMNYKLLYVLDDHGITTDRPGFYMYDLQTLKEIKFVAIPSTVTDPLDEKIIYPQIGANFYLEVEDMALNNGKGGFVNFAYDKKTQNYVGSVNNILSDRFGKFWISEDQNTIYVDTQQGNLQVYNSQTLQLTNSINLSKVYLSNLWSSDVIDIKNGIALLEEDKKLQITDKDNITLLTYRITDSATSPRIVPGVDYQTAILTSDGSKLIINEKKAIISSGTKAPKKAASAVGRLDVYDVKTGNKLGLITLPIDFADQILGIRPTNDKLYYLVISQDGNNEKLLIINLATLSVIKTISVPDLDFVFFSNE